MLLNYSQYKQSRKELKIERETTRYNRLGVDRSKVVPGWGLTDMRGARRQLTRVCDGETGIEFEAGARRLLLI